jgi:glutamate racemase
VIILGCTHYPFLQHSLSSAAAELFPADSQPVFIDPAVETANQVHDMLLDYGLVNSSNARTTSRYFVSGEPATFERNGSLFLGAKIDGVQSVNLS